MESPDAIFLKLRDVSGSGGANNAHGDVPKTLN